MDVRVVGGRQVRGTVRPHGAKNAIVAQIPATVLFDTPVTLRNVPDITDVRQQLTMLEALGSRITWDQASGVLTIDNSGLSVDRFGDLAPSMMRGTTVFWGPLVSRFGSIRFRTEPLGCSLGARPMIAHYQMLEDLGVDVRVTDNGVQLDQRDTQPRSIWLYEASPTATESAILRALSLKGTSTIDNAACEPHVQDLCRMLVSAGASINGIGTNRLFVHGQPQLNSVEHRIVADHCEVTTFLAIAAIAGGELRVEDAVPEHMGFIRKVFRLFGIEIRYEGDTAIIDAGQQVRINSNQAPLTLKCHPWPALPVDLLPLFIPMALAAHRGQVLFHNWMYERGLRWVDELSKLGGNIMTADIHRVLVTGGNRLVGTTLVAPDIIRATVAMVMAGLIAEGETLIKHADYLDRGHPEFDHNLRAIGLDIKREY
ncbi:UDP-N-acetylglucosamine 1-carboxyvinyltransferase [candidate division WWE3 bacterium]|nr:UDP-N-acetylglucosamine 1-carboxyvinyltransferase [candidate division WWE3 bacterium]